MPGLADLFAGRASFVEVIRRDLSTSLDVIPSGGESAAKRSTMFSPGWPLPTTASFFTLWTGEPRRRGRPQRSPTRSSSSRRRRGCDRRSMRRGKPSSPAGPIFSASRHAARSRLAKRSAESPPLADVKPGRLSVGDGRQVAGGNASIPGEATQSPRGLLSSRPSGG